MSGLRFFAGDGQKTLPQKIKLSSLILETLSLCRERFTNQGVQLDLVAEDTYEAIEIECRSVEISQVLLNILNNAYYAIENNKDKWIRINVSETEDQVEISITDSGEGISKEIQEKIMQPFFTTKEIGKGTGLGLSISKGIIDQHNGKLYLDTASANTRFVLCLPKVIYRSGEG